MKPSTIGGHSAYQDFFLMQLRKYYPDAAESLPSSTWDIMERFWNLDLSPLNSLMQDCYSVFGPAPRQPSDMLRSILLSVEFKIPTVTQWCAELRHNHLYAILSGFPVLALSTISSIGYGNLISQIYATRSIPRRDLRKSLIKKA